MLCDVSLRGHFVSVFAIYSAEQGDNMKLTQLTRNEAKVVKQKVIKQQTKSQQMKSVNQKSVMRKDNKVMRLNSEN